MLRNTNQGLWDHMFYFNCINVIKTCELLTYRELLSQDWTLYQTIFHGHTF